MAKVSTDNQISKGTSEYNIGVAAFTAIRMAIMQGNANKKASMIEMIEEEEIVILIFT